jgi:hypothetical protein
MRMVEHGDDLNLEEILVIWQWARRQKVHPQRPTGPAAGL